MMVPMMSFTLILLLLLIISSFPEYKATNVPENDKDKRALLAFKSQINDDPLGVLSSWNDSSHFCNWTGVTCGRLQIPRVIGLILTQRKLAGNISPHVGNLSFVRRLELSDNFLNGEIPEEVGNLRRIRILNISNNLIGGRIPVNLSNCSQLTNLALDHNHLSGSIPPEIGSLSSLITLELGNNQLTGTFPPSFGNLTSLVEMDMMENNLTGEIPSTISQLKNLEAFWVSSNHLSGEFPPSLYNLTTLELIGLAGNRFTGNLRNDIGLVLPNLMAIAAGGNFFGGAIPSTFSNSSKLSVIDLPSNNFSGEVPPDLGRLDLRRVGLAFNNLGTGEPGDLDFITTLTNCSNLKFLDLAANGFGGHLPVSIANLSADLTELLLDQNLIRGSIPGDIVRLQKLEKLYMAVNHLGGTIPDSLGMLPNLRLLFLNSNHFTGHIPPSIGNISSLLLLALANNRLTGSVPSSLANLKQLIGFWAAQNNLKGTIRKEIMSVSSLLSFNVSFNSITGSLPNNVVENLNNLARIDLSHNKFSGVIPNSLGECLPLEFIFLQGNSFQGKIPNLTRLYNLQYLDLSSNNLSGNIPDYLESLPSLLYLNLSFNILDGEVPSKGVFSNASAVDTRENHKLCGGIPDLHLPTCPLEASTKAKNKHGLNHVKLILLVIVVPSFFASLLLVLMIFLKKRRSMKAPESVSASQNFFPMISYEELLKSTNGFTPENLIGVGGFGKVYKGTLSSDGTEVAVKVLNLEQRGASKSFISECQALRNIRHHNLVKVITACSSTDFQGSDFKALVYQLMPNGSLDRWLHPEEETTRHNSLNILQRINIVTGVASALSYLHHECQTQVIHCDLKPHNILLDGDMIAHIGDFGLARLFPEFTVNENGNQFSSLGIKGTIGYAAPEYGMGIKASIMGDVYSFGIILLEIFTGKRPTDNLFQENMNLHNFGKTAIPDKVMEVLDNSALCEEVTGETETWEEGWSNLTSEGQNCLIHILQIGVACSVESPQDRMSMRQVCRELSIIKETFFSKLDLRKRRNIDMATATSFSP